jgi:uncharacterized protein
MHPRPWPALTLPAPEYGGARHAYPNVPGRRGHHFSHSSTSHGENLHASPQGGMTNRLSRPSVSGDSAYRFTPLMRAITADDNHAVARMLHAGVNPMGPTSNGTSPLMVAIHFNNQTATRLLIQANAYVNQGTPQGVTALMVAAIHSNRQALRLLIAAGAEIDQATSNGQTATMIASQFGNEDSLILLRAAGADLNRQDHNGRSALTYAALHSQKKILTQLWLLNADFDRVVRHGNLIQCLETRGQPEIAQLLRRIILLPDRPAACTSSEAECHTFAPLTAPESNLETDTCMSLPATVTAFSASWPTQSREPSSKRAREPIAATPPPAEAMDDLWDLPLPKYARS